MIWSAEPRPAQSNLISGNTNDGIYISGGSFLVSEDNNVVSVDAQTGAVLATYPTALANDSIAIGSDGSFYVPDYYNGVIDHYNAAGTLLSTFGSGTLPPAGHGLRAGRKPLFSNVGAGVQKFSPSGAYLGAFVANGSGGLNNVKGMIFGPDGNFYVVNYTDSDVLKFNGTTGALIGTFVASGSGGLYSCRRPGLRVPTEISMSATIRITPSIATTAPLGLDGSFRDDQSVHTIRNSIRFIRQPGRCVSVAGHNPNLQRPDRRFPSQPRLGADQPRLVHDNDIFRRRGHPRQRHLVQHRRRGQGPGGQPEYITQNSIFGNQKFGIDLTADVVTANTGARNAANPNDGMNYPVVTIANLSGSQFTVAGYVGTLPATVAFANAMVEFFKSDISTGSASGRTYLGTLTTDAAGNFTGTFSAALLSGGEGVTATATDASGNTSQFGASFVVNAAPTVATPTAAPSLVTGTTTALSVLGADDGGESHLTYTWAAVGPTPAPVTFSPNGTTARNTTATFTVAGNYNFQVTITDEGEVFHHLHRSVTVQLTLTTVVVTPGTTSLYDGWPAAIRGNRLRPIRDAVAAAGIHLGRFRRWVDRRLGPVHNLLHRRLHDPRRRRLGERHGVGHS